MNFKQDGGEMKGVKIIFGFFAVIVLILVANAVLRTVPINGCGENGTELACIQLSPGFSIDYYAENIKSARSMALSPNGKLVISC